VATRFDGSEQEKQALDLWVKLSRSSSSVEAIVARSLVGTGVTLSQFGVLDALYHLGEMKLGTLAVKHLRSPNNMTSVVDTMERAGLVCRARQQADRRIILVSITSKGSAAFEEIWPKHLAAIVQAVDGVDDREKAVLAELLRKLGLSASQTNP
jgi:MarR family transcriptional regulator, 2-MHQ and catechol-resistance regulon repressor